MLPIVYIQTAGELLLRAKRFTELSTVLLSKYSLGDICVELVHADETVLEKNMDKVTKCVLNIDATLKKILYQRWTLVPLQYPPYILS